jgi:hypothetical protein
VTIVMAQRDCYGILAVMLLGVVGCGGSTGDSGTVTGIATLDGKPVAKGCTVSCQHVKSSLPAVGTINENGAFTLKMGGTSQLSTGEFKVVVSAPRNEMNNDQIMKLKAEGKSPPSDDEFVPAKYRSYDTSGLQLTVQPGQNKFDIQMTR